MMAEEIGKSEFYVKYRLKVLGLSLTEEEKRERWARNILRCNQAPRPKRTPQYHVARPYKVGHKIRITIGKDPGHFRATYGEVVRVLPGNKPVVEYCNLSGLKLSEFDRHVYRKEVALSGPFFIHREYPGSSRSETEPGRLLDWEEVEEVEEMELEEV